MLPLSDGVPARRFPVVNVALIAANFAVWILYELPHLHVAVYHASFYACAVDNACRAPEPWGISWITAMFLHGSWDHILGDAFLAAWVPTIMAACYWETSGFSPDHSNVPGPGKNGPGGGRIGAVLLSPLIKPGTVSTVDYNHYSPLRTIEDIFGLPPESVISPLRPTGAAS